MSHRLIGCGISFLFARQVCLATPAHFCRLNAGEFKDLARPVTRSEQPPLFLTLMPLIFIGNHDGLHVHAQSQRAPGVQRGERSHHTPRVEERKGLSILVLTMVCPFGISGNQEEDHIRRSQYPDSIQDTQSSVLL